MESLQQTQEDSTRVSKCNFPTKSLPATQLGDLAFNLAGFKGSGTLMTMLYKETSKA